MKEPWYCGVNGEQYGPYTWDQMLAMAAEGRLVPETYVRRESDRQWYSAAQVPGLLGRKGPVAAAAVPASASSSAIGISARPASASSSSISAGPAARNPPSVPVGTVPVRTAPVGTVPVGTAVAPAPATSEPPAIVVTPPKTALQAGATSPAMSAQSTADPSADVASQPKSPWLLAGILAGTALVILVLGAGIVAAVWWQRDDAPLASAQGATDEVPDEVLAPGEEANPAGQQAAAVEPNTAQASEATEPSRSPTLSSRDLAAAKKTIAQQGRWTDAQRFGRYRAGKVDLLLVGIWLAADEAGTWVEPALPDRASSASGGAGGAKYVFVELRLFNSGMVPQKFVSWNEAGPADVVLAHEDGTILPLVPATETPDARRLSETRILPGEAVHDLVVFEAPPAPFEKLKLVLAKSALADSLKGHLALEVPVEYLFRRPAASSAPAAPSAPITARQMPADPGGAGLSEPPAITAAITSANDPAADPPSEPAPVAATAKKKGPPSKEELNKLFEEFDKPAAGNAEAPDE